MEVADATIDPRFKANPLAPPERQGFGSIPHPAQSGQGHFERSNP